MKREPIQTLDSKHGWSHSSTKLYRVLMKRLEAKNDMVMFKSRPSSVKRFVRVIKKRHFMSYDVMAYQSIREMVIPIDPQRTDSIMEDDIVIMCNKDKVRWLSGMKYILMDGTFSVAPPGFMQVYTIHCGFDKGIHFTLFYVVMKRRRE